MGDFFLIVTKNFVNRPILKQDDKKANRFVLRKRFVRTEKNVSYSMVLAGLNLQISCVCLCD